MRIGVYLDFLSVLEEHVSYLLFELNPLRVMKIISGSE